MSNALRGRPRTIAVFALAITGIVVLALLAFALYAAAREDTPVPFGTDVGGDAAPDFRLTNQFGRTVTLSEQRGKVVVLTFLYTQCPDVCPLTAARLRAVYEQLGAAAADVSMLAVSVDPEQDTVSAAYDFSARFDLVDRWSFLVGDRQQLEAVWKDYYIGVREVDGDDLLHNAPIYLIDREGKRQLLHTTGGETDAIIGEVVHDIRLLLKQSGTD